MVKMVGMNTYKNILPVGSIVHGSFRIEDLLPAFLFALEDVDAVAATRFGSELIELGFGYSQCGVCFGPREEWPNVDDETLIDIQEEVSDKLNEYVPAGCYFGAHEGDGSDFGVWDISPAFEEYDADACSVLR
mgnify:FL=1